MATEQTVQTARAEAGAVAGTVKEETKNVAEEAQQQASSALHQVQDDVRTRANEEATKFAQTLHNTSQQLQSMAGAAGDNGVASSLVREGASATERLATRLDQGGVEALMADARAFARRAARRVLARRGHGGVPHRSPRSEPERQRQPTGSQGIGQRASGDPGLRRHGQRVRLASRQQRRLGMTRIEPDPTKPKEPDKSLGDLFGDLSHEFSELVRAQTELAKSEIRTQADKAKRAPARSVARRWPRTWHWFSLSFAAAWGLSEVVPEGVAFLIVGLIYAAIAAVMYLRGRERGTRISASFPKRPLNR